ncbi:MAG: beta-propeller domain-containing protein [Clostridia bacterium]|nr:beta-propeller domain-containing protein [Clostridia bacterium]
MFSKKYKKANEAVKLSDKDKERILTNMRENKITNTHNKKNTRKRNTIIAAVAAACVTIFLAGYLINGLDMLYGDHDNRKEKDFTAHVSEPADYNEIFMQLEKLQKETEQLYTNGIKGEIIVEDAMGADDAETVIQGTNDAPESSRDEDFSETNTQVEGVDEADIIKTDGKYIYAMNEKCVNIFKPDGENTTFIGRIKRESEADGYAFMGMYLHKDTLVIIASTFSYTYGYKVYADDYTYSDSEKSMTRVLFYDITDPEKPIFKNATAQDGAYENSRLSNGVLYTVSSHYAYTYWDDVNKDEPESFVPCVEYSGKRVVIAAEDIKLLDDVSPNYSVVTSVDMENTQEIKSSLGALGSISGMYASTDNILLYSNTYVTDEYKVKQNEDGTYEKVSDDADSDIYGTHGRNIANLYLISMNDGDLKLEKTQTVNGMIDSQFSLDEYDDHFRIVTNYTEHYGFYEKRKDIFGGEQYNYYTDSQNRETNNLYVLDNKLEVTGLIENIARDEAIKSARFMGDIGYFVTFRQTDPLFSVDLSDHENPKIIGELKIPGFSEYLQSYGEGLLFGFGYAADENTGGTYGIKLSMFDVSDPENVSETACTELHGKWSSACDNHKAILADAEKNIIGFPVENGYMIYSYDGEKFLEEGVVEIKNHDWTWDMRGMYIGDYYYVADTRNGNLIVLDMVNFRMLATVTAK